MRHAEPLAAGDLRELERLLFETDGLGTREDFERAYPERPDLVGFVRSLVGMDRETAKRAFGQFLDGSRFTAQQIRFVNLLVDHLTRSGSVDPSVLYEAPYTDLDPSGLGGLFTEEQGRQIIQIVAGLGDAGSANGSVA